MEVSDLTPAGAHPSATIPILVIEDNLSDVRLMAEGFTERGVPAKLLVARTIREVQGFMRLLPASGLPRLVVVDLSLPIASGHSVLAMLGVDPHWRPIPKVVLSSSCRPEDRTRSLAAGAREHLVKPSTFDEVLGIVDRLRLHLATTTA
jgi:two-component system response regulator